MMLTKEWLKSYVPFCKQQVDPEVCPQCGYTERCPYVLEHLKDRRKKRMVDAGEKVRAWNARYPVGHRVRILSYNGDVFDTYTKTEAQLLGHLAIIWVEGLSACYLLDQVTAL